MWIDIIWRLDLDFLHEADEWQQNDNTISKKSTQQVEIRQNSLVSAVKNNKKHHITTLQRGFWIILIWNTAYFIRQVIIRITCLLSIYSYYSGFWNSELSITIFHLRFSENMLIVCFSFLYQNPYIVELR